MKKEPTATQGEKPELPPLTPQEAAKRIVDNLVRKAADGELDAVGLLKETVQEAKLEKLRKELFGV